MIKYVARIWVVGMVILLAWSCTELRGSEWCWDPSSGATGYRIYWSASPTTWSACYRFDVSAVNACPPGDPMVCCDGGGTPMPEGDLVFFVVTAYNGVGESATEHGVVEECP